MVTALFSAMLIVAQAAEPAQPAQQPVRVETPADATIAALVDAHTLPKESLPFQRYLWAPRTMPAEWPAVINYTVNLSASKSAVIQRGVVVGRLMRYDLRQLAPRTDDLVKLGQLWDDLAAVDPYFSVTKDANVNGKVVKVTSFAPHLTEAATELATMTISKSPVLRADWFIIKLLTTADGGKYYDFAGIERNPKDGKTAQAAFLASVGADEKVSLNLQAVQRAVMYRSKVTSKPRRIDFIRGVGGRAGSGFVTLTHDVQDGDVDGVRNPMLSLLRFADRAREIIVEGNNGLPKFAITNNKEELVDEVPPNVAMDSTIPHPHTQRLEPARGCIVCHGPDEGYIPFTNDLTKLLAAAKGQRYDVFTDLNGKVLNEAEVLDLFAGFYADNDGLERRVARARDDYAAAVWKATGGMSPKAIAQAVDDVFRAYRYALVTPARACAELGLEVPEAKAVRGINFLLGTLPADANGIAPEDGRLAALKAGLDINRGDWEQAYPDAQFRANSALEEIAEKQANAK